MSDPVHPQELQFFTTEDGHHFSCFGNAGPFTEIQLSPASIPGSSASTAKLLSSALGFLTIMQNGVAVPIGGPNDIPIDPILIKLPENDDEDFLLPHKLVPTIRDDCPKKKPTKDVELKKKHSGQLVDASNYSTEDVNALLDILEEHRLLGARAWNTCANEYTVWAEDSECPVHTLKSLENKFKQLMQTPKPTGDAECPPEIERAHIIKELMNEKAGTHDLNDSDIVDDIDDDSDKEEEVIELSGDDDDVTPPLPKKPKTIKHEQGPSVKQELPAGKKKVLITHHSVSDHLLARAHMSHAGANDLLSSISSALDP
ncbi:uncharacterized protein ARMOST_00588 [Armillaria ostoyae]|uniref:DUF6818 domain-containing protein n=1 Tax=Armillaria ostoyae TaxID=47428 RepID=A0A284QLJ8_ARMOS|nr:uncharacterized protein ARMOST_00588 [Armillaria ostoyae]